MSHLYTLLTRNVEHALHPSPLIPEMMFILHDSADMIYNPDKHLVALQEVVCSWRLR